MFALFTFEALLIFLIGGTNAMGVKKVKFSECQLRNLGTNWHEKKIKDLGKNG